MTSQLQTSLQTTIDKGWQSNPATNQIISEYARYHAVLAVAGGIFLLILLWLCVRFWIKFKKIPKIRTLHWNFEKKVYFGFASLFTMVALFLALVTLANISTAAKPLPGFTGSISTITDNSYNQKLHSAFNDWIVSKKSTPPALVQQRIHERRVFHAVRFVMSTVMLVGFAVASVYVWRYLIAQRADSKTKPTIKQALLMFVGVWCVLVALFLMLAVMANLQGFIYPLVNTFQFG